VELRGEKEALSGPPTFITGNRMQGVLAPHVGEDPLCAFSKKRGGNGRRGPFWPGEKKKRGRCANFKGGKCSPDTLTRIWGGPVENQKFNVGRKKGSPIPPRKKREKVITPCAATE